MNIKALSSLIVGQGSSYQFMFNLTTLYNINKTIRVNFPVSFSTNKPVCKLDGLVGQYNQIIPTYILPNNRSVECRNINKTL
jgi:hypothetical protein